MDVIEQKSLEPVVFDLFKGLTGSFPKPEEEYDAWKIYTILTGKQLKSTSNKKGIWQVSDGTYAIGEITNPPNITGVLSCVGVTGILNSQVMSVHFLDPSAPSLKQKYGLNPQGQELNRIIENYNRFFQELTEFRECSKIIFNSKLGLNQPYWNMLLEIFGKQQKSTKFEFIESVNFQYV